jgi:hypothetical protein
MVFSEDYRRAAGYAGYRTGKDFTSVVNYGKAALMPAFLSPV